MINWMIEVLHSFKQGPEVLFLATSMMDMYFKAEMRKELKVDSDLHRVGVTCIWIASKFDGKCPLTGTIVSEKIAHGKLSVKDLLFSERVILNTIDYRVTASPSVWDLF